MCSTKRGFTLIEISIVLIVIGLLVGGSAKLYTALAKRSKQIQTQNYVETLQNTIDGFAYTFKRLPTQSELKTMSIRLEDSWNKEIHYSVDEVLTQEETLCQAKQSALIMDNQIKSVRNIAYVLVSSGVNRNMQTAFESKRIKWAAPMQEVDYDSHDVLRVEPYDDIVSGVSLFSLKRVAQCR